MANDPQTKDEKAARRKAKTELRNARKAFRNAEYAMVKAREGYKYAADRLMTAAAAAGEPA
jgi:hypothetical protein